MCISNANKSTIRDKLITLVGVFHLVYPRLTIKILGIYNIDLYDFLNYLRYHIKSKV